jgi:hypothetical protein
MLNRLAVSLDVDCKTYSDLVDAIVVLNNKLNRLSPSYVSGDRPLAEISALRDALLIEMRHHRKKGHDGKPCPAAPHAQRN